MNDDRHDNPRVAHEHRRLLISMNCGCIASAGRRGVADKRSTRVLVYPFTGTGAVNVTRGDLKRLDAGQYLNDTIIEFGLKCVCRPSFLRLRLTRYAGYGWMICAKKDLISQSKCMSSTRSSTRSSSASGSACRVSTRPASVLTLLLASRARTIAFASGRRRWISSRRSISLCPSTRSAYSSCLNGIYH